MDIIYLDFNKAFDSIFHSALLEALAAPGLDGHGLGKNQSGQLSARCWEKGVFISQRGEVTTLA